MISRSRRQSPGDLLLNPLVFASFPERREEGGGGERGAERGRQRQTDIQTEGERERERESKKERERERESKKST